MNENTSFKQYLKESGFSLMQYQEEVYNAWKYVKVKIVEWRDNQNMKIQFKVPKYDYVKEDVSEIKKYIFDELAYDMDYYGDGLECRSI